MSREDRIKKAHDLFKTAADKVGIPNASEFKTEAAADEALGPKLFDLQAEFEAACNDNGLHFTDAWDLAMPVYLRTKGWTVDYIDGAWVVVTKDVEK